jgi:hypothetical protein
LVERSAACSRRASRLDGVEKRWRRLVVHSLVSEDASFDARRTASAKPTPRFILMLITPLAVGPVVNTRPSAPFEFD